jgi:hypothetical protein
MSDAENTPVEQTETETTTETTTTEEQSAQLQIGDIEAAVKVIDYASEQGAFKGWQVVQEVLVLRNRLVHFVRAVTPPEAEAAEGDAAETTEAAAEVPEAPGADA